MNEELSDEIHLLRRQMTLVRARGASKKALRDLARSLTVLERTTPQRDGVRLVDVEQQMHRLAVRLGRRRVAVGRQVPTMRYCCTAHPYRAAVGEHWRGRRWVTYLCEECFRKAREQDERESRRLYRSFPHKPNRGVRKWLRWARTCP